MKPYESEFNIQIPRRKEALKSAVKMMAKRFGGVTVVPVKGAWLDERGRIVYDNNYLLFSTRDLNGVKKSILPKDKRFMEDVARKLGKMTKQEAIWIEEDLIKDAEIVKMKEVI